MADTRLRAIIESVYERAGTDAAKKGFADVGQAGTQATGGIDQLRTSSNALSGVLGKLAAAGLLAKIGQEALEFGKASIQAASDAEEMQAKFDVVFGKSAPQAQAALEDLASQVNRSATDLQGMAATVQDTFVPLGFARDQAAELSVGLTQLAVDVASFNNAQDTDVMRDFQSALVGNTETVRKYGIVITEANTKQKAYEMGLAEVGEELTEQEKVQARLQLITEGTTDAQGDAIRTADSYANVMKGLQAATLDLQIAVGQQLNPALAEAGILMTSMVKETTPNITAQLALINAVRDGTLTYAEGTIIWNEWILTGKTAEDVLYEIEIATTKNTEALNYSELATREVADATATWAEDTFYAKQAQAALETQVVSNTGKLYALQSAIEGVIGSVKFENQAESLLNEVLEEQGLTISEVNERKIEFAYLTGEITKAEYADLQAKNEQIKRLEDLNGALAGNMITLAQWNDIIKDGKISVEELGAAMRATWNDTLDASLESATREAEEQAAVFGDLYDRTADVEEIFAPFVEAVLKGGTSIAELTGMTQGLTTATGETTAAVEALGIAANAIEGTYNLHFEITQSGDIPVVSGGGGGSAGPGQEAPPGPRFDIRVGDPTGLPGTTPTPQGAPTGRGRFGQPTGASEADRLNQTFNSLTALEQARVEQLVYNHGVDYAAAIQQVISQRVGGTQALPPPPPQGTPTGNSPFGEGGRPVGSPFGTGGRRGTDPFGSPGRGLDNPLSDFSVQDGNVIYQLIIYSQAQTENLIADFQTLAALGALTPGA